LVSDIQRFSVHDGPGIRTTVFLKGCNLHCRWCHNPETISPSAQLHIFDDKCIRCGACLKACPRGAHRLTAEGKREFRRDLCGVCGACAAVCYAQALVMVGRRMSAQAVADEALEDVDFYRNSGGGVTLSGGEPLVQRDFAVEVLRLCRQAGLHTAIETNLCRPWKHVASVLPFADLVMADIKVMDNSLHRRWTGRSNRAILANVLRLGRSAASLVVRTPIVPGVNDTVEAIRSIAEHIAGLPNLAYYELLPYHPLGTGKYHSLGLECPTEAIAQPSRETMRLLAGAARQCGIKSLPE